jgi:hypothetical protein
VAKEERFPLDFVCLHEQTFLVFFLSSKMKGGKRDAGKKDRDKKGETTRRNQ